MLVVHHLGVSQSDRIVWLCEELEIPYEMVRYERDPVTRLAPANYKALSPFGTAPVITDGDLVLGESGAIIDYIIARHANGRLAVAADHADFADYLFWFHFANGSLMTSMMMDLAFAMSTVEETEAIRSLKSRSSLAFEMIDRRLASVPYLAGQDFSAADIISLFPLTRMRMILPRNLSPYPHLRAYLKRIGQRPAFQRAMEKADPGLPTYLD